MKIRIKQAGFEAYSGQMGVIFFKDGVSENDVDLKDAIRVSAVMQCEWENGESVSIAQSILDNANTPAPTFVSGDEGQHDIERQVMQERSGEPVGEAYTEEELSAIADSEGIKGLRAIAEPMGIKGNSIKDLITALIEAKAVKA